MMIPSTVRTQKLLPWIAILIALALPALACALPGIAASTPTTPPSPTAKSAATELPLMPNDEFILKLPDGKAVGLTVTTCEGTGTGGYLQVVATNTKDTSDPKRVEVQVSGSNQGAGEYENMYIAVLMGTTDQSLFGGNTPKAKVTLAADSSGSFKDVSIVNIASNPTYKYGTEYMFSAEWSCKR